jgi:hypothetical protein
MNAEYRELFVAILGVARHPDGADHLAISVADQQVRPQAPENVLMNELLRRPSQ